MNLNEIINQLKQLISQNFNGFHGLYLYGSRVQGTYNANSDLDVIILFNRNLLYQEKLDLAGIIGELEYKSNIFIDYHPMTMDELKASKRFYNEVTVKGIYYDAA